MSSKIDERIVGMKFNGDQFQKGVADTSKALEALKQKLSFKDASKELTDLNTAGKNFNLQGLADGVQGIASKFSALSVIGITALANIASKAVDAGLTLVRSLTIDPVRAGLAEYELKMGSIQTILANTSRHGTGLQEVTDNLDELNAYADRTIYNFGEMTKNIGLFTNAGLTVGDATTMIKGFSNEAAASGTSAQGAAGAAYQLSQALSAGTIRLMDWRSLTNVGMGNKNMQNGLIEIADAMGTLESSSISASDVQKDFNGSLEKNWLSADVMSSYLKVMAQDNYDLAKAQALGLGLTEQQADLMAKQAVTANEAATKVRTWTQLIGTLQEGVGSGWATTFDILIGNFDQATELWTRVNDAIGPMIGGMADARNLLLQGWANEGGRDQVIEGLAKSFKFLGDLIKPVRKAFTDVFPPITVETLMNMTNAFTKFTDGLRLGYKEFGYINRIADGFFAILDIGRMIIVEAWDMFVGLFSGVGETSMGFVAIAANVGDFIVKIRDMLKEGTLLETIFDRIGAVVQFPINAFKTLVGWSEILLGKMFSFEGLKEIWNGIADAFAWLGEVLAPVGEWLSEAFVQVKDGVTQFFKTLDFNVLVGLLNVGALGGVGLMIKKLVDQIKDIFNKEGGGTGLMDTIKGVFGSITDTFGQMQNTLKAASLMGIAVAIGLITAAVVALSFVDTAKLAISLAAMGVMFGMLAGMVVLMEKVVKSKGFMKIPFVAGALISLGIAMVILAAAVKIFSTMNWEELARGMAAMAVGLGLLVGASTLLGKMSGRLIFAAPALVAISVAMVILAGALKIFATMSWEELGRAGAALAGTLGIIVGAMALVHSKLFAAASMVVIAAAMTIIAGALKIFGTMSWDEIFRGVTAFAGAMAVMAIGMGLMGALGGSGLLGAAAMVIAAAAITILAGALKIMGSMDWDTIGRTMVVLAGGLAILAAAMAIMGIPLVALGGAALFVVSAGLMMLAPALAILGTMSWDAIGRGLTMLGASIAILAVGGLLLIPASVGFLALGAAILMLGTGAFLAGMGITAFAAAIGVLAAAGTIGAEALKVVVTTMIALIPTFMQAFAQGLIDFAMVIAGGAIQFTAAMTTLIQSLLMAIQANGPMVLDTIWILVVSLVEKLVEGIPYFVDAGARMITGVLNGLAKNMGLIINAATNLIVEFINGISRSLPRIINSGMNLIVTFVQGLADGVRNNSARMRSAAGDLASAIIDGMTGGLASGIGRVVEKAKEVANSALKAAKNFLGIKSPSKEFTKIGAWSSEGMAIGLSKSAPMVARAAQGVGKTALTTMQKSLSTLKNSVASDININPTITPVLDLTAFKQKSALIGGMLTPPTLKVDDSYAYASSIVSQQRQNDQIRAENDVAATSETSWNFTQINNSPKALSQAEIYRQTNNQLSSVKKKGQPTYA